MPVTRTEIADLLRPTFDTSIRLERSDLIDAAIAGGARPEVVMVLAHLSDTRFQRMQDLWTDLADLPIDLDTGAQR